jgi:hypothetical protein
VTAPLRRRVTAKFTLQLTGDGQVGVLKGTRDPDGTRVHFGKVHGFVSGNDDSIGGSWQQVEVTVEVPTYE